MIDEMRFFKECQKHKNKYYMPPTSYLNNKARLGYFLERSFASSAADEILKNVRDIVLDSEDLKMVRIENWLERFREKMNDASTETSGDQAFLYAVCSDVTTDFIDLLIKFKHIDVVRENKKEKKYGKEGY